MKNNSITPTFLGDTEHVFVQANHFIQARYKDPLSYWETVIFGKMCTLIGSEDNDFKDYRVHIKDLISMLDVTKTGRVYEDFVEAANRLRTREIIIKFPDEKGKEMTLETALVTGVARLTRTRKPDDMFVDLNIHPKLIPFLIELRKDFTLLDLRDYKHLHSATSIRIYHILKSYMGRGNANPEIDVEKLKGMLGLTNKYPHYANFKARVLEDARRRLLDGAYLAFDYEELKEAGRGSGRVVAVRFQLFANTPKHAQTEMSEQLNPQGVLFLPEVDKSRPNTVSNSPSKQKNIEEVVAVEVSQDDWTSKILSFGVKPKQLTQLKDEFSEADMRQAIAVTEGVIASGKLKTSAAGFFVSALKNHYEVAKPLKTVRKEALNADKIQTKTNEPNAKVSADDLAKADKVAEKTAATRQQFEQEKAIVDKLVEEDLELVNEAVAEIRRGMFGFTYNEDKSFAENRENKVFEAAFLNTIKKLRGNLFK
jgi:plasmid replication initiation protein